MMNYGAVVSHSMYRETATSAPVRLIITWMDFEPGYPKYKEAGVVTGAVLFGEINPLKPN